MLSFRASAFIRFLGAHSYDFKDYYNLNLSMTKQNKMTCAPSKDSDQRGHLPRLIRVFAVRMRKPWSLATYKPQSKDSDLKLPWVHVILLVLSCSGSIIFLISYTTDHLHSLVRVFARRSKGSYGPKASSWGQQRLWSDWADAQADQSTCHFVGFVKLRFKSVPLTTVIVCNILPSTLASKKLSLYCGSPISSNHRITQVWSRILALLCGPEFMSCIANWSFFLCKGCRIHNSCKKVK